MQNNFCVIEYESEFYRGPSQEIYILNFCLKISLQKFRILNKFEVDRSIPSGYLPADDVPENELQKFFVPFDMLGYEKS